MNIILMAFGSRGDIQPFPGLAVALREGGHSVTLAAPCDFETQINAWHIPYIPIPISNMEVLQKEATKGVTRRMTPAALLAFWRGVIPEFKRALLTTTHDVAEVARDADLLIAHGFLIPCAYSIHQHLKVPLMLGIAAPVVSTKIFPSPAFPPIPVGQRFYNPLTFQMLVRGVVSFMIEPMNAYRREVGLPTLSAGKVVQITIQWANSNCNALQPPFDAYAFRLGGEYACGWRVDTAHATRLDAAGCPLCIPGAGKAARLFRLWQYARVRSPTYAANYP
jgi:sterol 3beta-glucosyltransferase